MRGLILKDWYSTWRYCKLHLGVVLFVAALSLVRSIGETYLMYAMLFGGMIPVYTLSVDEKFGWNRYALTLPYSRRDVVTGKYLYTLILLCGTALLMLILWGGRALVTGSGMKEALGVLSFMLSFAIVFPAATLPFMYRFGVEKGRIIMLVLVAILLGALFCTNMVASSSGGIELPAYPSSSPLLLLGMLVLLLLSWLLAVRLYEKREL